MINGLDIYYTKKERVYGEGLTPVSTNKKSQSAKGLKPISKGKGCKKNTWQRITNTTMNLIFINNI